jgi:hypothetical protein
VDAVEVEMLEVEVEMLEVEVEMPEEAKVEVEVLAEDED